MEKLLFFAGLRIAPPEAPVTGYMFGKGIYFADMVSKSANYCATTPNNPTGLMLLCDVALGKVRFCSFTSPFHTRCSIYRVLQFFLIWFRNIGTLCIFLH